MPPAPRIKKEIPYGIRVKKRRMASIQLLNSDESLSISKKRKIVEEQEKSFRKPNYHIDKRCGKLYEELIRSDNKEQSANDILSFILPIEDDPSQDNYIQANLRSNVMQNTVQCLSKPIISRLLQAILKYGTSEQKLRVIHQIKPSFAVLAKTNAGGSHLCVKTITYAPKTEIPSLLQTLLEYPKSYFSKNGAKVWDFALRKTASAKVRNQFLLKLFVEKVVAATEYRGEKLFATHPDELLKNLEPDLLVLLRERCLEYVDKIVLKELLGSDIAQHFLHYLTRNEALLDDKGMDRLAEAVFEGAQALLATKEGVWVLCRIMGYWNAKQRKQFLANIASTMKLEATTWTDYFTNAVVYPVLGRLLTTVDDTKLLAGSLIAPLLGLKLTKLGVLQKSDGKGDELERILANPKCLVQLVYAVKPSEALGLLTPLERDQLESGSPSSKKDPELRREEVKRWLAEAFGVMEVDFGSLKGESKGKFYDECLRAFVAAFSSS